MATINGPSGPITLTSANNPLTIGAKGDITGTPSLAAISGGAAASWSVTNHGTVASTAYGVAGINLNATNNTIVNDGLIIAPADPVGGARQSPGTAAILITGAAAITNKAGGTIQGPVRITGSGTISNAGTITGQLGCVSLGGGGEIDNTKTGLIDGGNGDVEIFGGSGIIKNAGLITSPVMLMAGGTITNTGTIDGIINVSGASSIDNTGTINGNLTIGAIGITTTNTIENAGSLGTITFGSNSTNSRLILGDPGSTAAANALAASNTTLELAKGIGTITHLGTDPTLSLGMVYNGFTTLQVDKGADWTLAGTSNAQTVTNDGTLAIDGPMTIQTVTAASTGTFDLAGQGYCTLDIGSDTATGTKMTFLSQSELLIDNASLFGTSVGSGTYNGPLLQSFAADDIINIKDFSTAGLTDTFAKGLLQITNTAGEHASLNFQTASLGTGAFHLAADASGGIFVTHA